MGSPQAPGRPWRVSAAPQGARLSSERCPPCLFPWHGQRAVSPATSSPASLMPVSTLSLRTAVYILHKQCSSNTGGGGCSQGPVSRSPPLLNTSPRLRLEAGSPGRSRGRTAAPQTAQCCPQAAAAGPHAACPAPPLLRARRACSCCPGLVLSCPQAECCPRDPGCTLVSRPAPTELTDAHSAQLRRHGVGTQGKQGCDRAAGKRTPFRLELL